MIPLVSIIIPTYNRAHLIEETLNSIIAQTYTNWECIIVDDGSTDDTEQILKKYLNRDKRFKFFFRPSTLIKGPCSCRNYGFEKSKGVYVKWFDSDDILLTDAIEIQINCFNKTTDLVVSKLALKNFSENKIIEVSQIFSNHEIEDYLLGKISFYVSGPLWKRSFLQDKVLFDSTIRNLDDWDFNLRMLYNKPKIFYLEQVIIHYRIHQNSLIHELDKLNLSEVKSEFHGRIKHLSLLRDKKLILIQKKFIISRGMYFLRNSFLQNSEQKTKFLFLTLKHQFKFKTYSKIIKTCIGFFSYSIFNKGYRFLKD